MSKTIRASSLRTVLLAVTVPLAAMVVSCSSGSTTGSTPKKATGSQTLPAALPPSATSTTTVPSRTSADAWGTYGRDVARTGNDPGSPRVSNPRPEWTSTDLDGAVYAQPLVIGSSVIAATENDTVYSLDVHSGRVNWSRHLASPVPGSSLRCGNIDPSGVTGTPVADAAIHALWVVTFSSPYAHTLWEIDLGSGRVLGSRPADPPGADPSTEQQRGALTLSSGRVYIPYGGLYGDCGNYHGWLVGLSATSPADRTMVTYETPATEAGIWAPGGAVVDNAGDIFVATGNGVPVDVPGDANSVIKLDPSLNVLARFTAPDYQHLSATDTDLGSVSPIITTGGDVLQVGKEGTGYLLGSNLGAPLQTFHVCSGGFGAAATTADNIYLSCFDGLYALDSHDAGHLSPTWAATGVKPGPPIVSGGVVWTVDRGGALDGFSETTGKMLYTYPVAVAGSFPTLSADAGKLLVADGKRIIAFGGV